MSSRWCIHSHYFGQAKTEVHQNNKQFHAVCVLGMWRFMTVHLKSDFDEPFLFKLMNIKHKHYVGWPCVPFFSRTHPCQDFYIALIQVPRESLENTRTDIIHRSVCTRKQSRIREILGNIEILVRKNGTYGGHTTLYLNV